MLPGVGVASCVAQPHVVAQIGQNVRQTIALIVQQKAGGGVEKAMHYQHRAFGGVLGSGRAVGNPVHFQDVAIFCFYTVNLGCIPAVHNPLGLFEQGEKDRRLDDYSYYLRVHKIR